MVDTNSRTTCEPNAMRAGAAKRERELNDALELFFFAYKAHTAAPDRVLHERGLQRTHHRILYFVGRNPGISVGGLLRFLGVSKQALHGPLRRLIELGLIDARASESDSRVKELRLSESGCELEDRLSGSEREGIAEVFSELGPEDEAAWRRVMEAVIRVNEGRGSA